jgi:hypothetical protein
MPGRHQLPPSRRPRLRWLAGGAGAAILAATALAFLPTASAGAAADPVAATFSVTGVTVSGCDLGIGGSDVWVKPGQELDVKSSVVGLTVPLLGPIDISDVAALGGNLVIDPGTASQRVIDNSGTKQVVNGLSAGDHPFTWDVTSVRLLPKLLGGLGTIPLSTKNLTKGAADVGASLHYAGTIHVTNDKSKCGIGVQVPGISASASVKGLPPINVGVPGVTVTVVSDLPSLPKLPVGGKTPAGSTPPAGGGASSPAEVGGELPVPARIVPDGGGNLIGGGEELPGSQATGVTAGQAPVAAANASTTSPAAPIVQQDSTGKHKTIDLAASKANSTGQFSVILAIVAIIALSVVAATYARLYLLRRETN